MPCIGPLDTIVNSSSVTETPKKLFRFTKKEFAEDFVNRGRICFSHARTFLQEALTTGQRDDERRRRFAPHADSWTYVFSKPGHNPLVVPFSELKNHSIQINLTNGSDGNPLDYFILCMSLDYKHLLFDDFKVDTCVEIHNPQELYERMRITLEQTYPALSLGGASVVYFDPTLPPPRVNSMLDYVFLKDATLYSHQTEFRAIILPQEVNCSLEVLKNERLFLDVGPLEDFCSILHKDNKLPLT